MKYNVVALLMILSPLSAAGAESEDLRQKAFLYQGLAPLQTNHPPVPQGIASWAQFPISQAHFEILQLRAIYLLGKLKDPQSIPTLENVAKPQNKFPEKHQKTALEAIKKIRTPGKPDLNGLVWNERMYGLPYTAQDLGFGLIEILSRDDELHKLPTRLISMTATSAIQAIIFLVWGLPAGLLSDGRLGPVGSEWTTQLINFVPWGLGGLKLFPKIKPIKSTPKKPEPAEIPHEELLRKIIQDGDFKNYRDLFWYARSLPDEFAQELSSLDPKGLWIDSGSGKTHAGEQYFEMKPVDVPNDLPNIKALASTPLEQRAQVLGITYNLERTTPPTFNEKLHVMTGRYLENIPVEEIGLNAADLITDFYGPLSYSWRIDLVLKHYFQVLKPSGKIYIFAGGETSPLLMTTIETSTGKLSLLQWLQTIPGLRVELLQKEWLMPGENLYTLKIEKLANETLHIPNLKMNQPPHGSPPYRIFEEAPPKLQTDIQTMVFGPEVLKKFFKSYPSFIPYKEMLESLKTWKVLSLGGDEFIFATMKENVIGHWSVRFVKKPGDSIPTISIKLDRSFRCTTPEAIAEIEQALLLTREELGLSDLKLKIEIHKGKKQHQMFSIYDILEFEIPSSPASPHLLGLLMESNTLSETLRTHVGNEFLSFYQGIGEGRRSDPLTLPIRPKRALRSSVRNLLGEFSDLKVYEGLMDPWMMKWRKVKSTEQKPNSWQATQTTRYGETILQISKKSDGEFDMNVKFRHTPRIFTEEILAEVEEAILLTRQSLSLPNLELKIKATPYHVVEGYPTLVSEVSFRIPIQPETMHLMNYILNEKAMSPMVRRVRQRLANPFIDRTGIITLPERTELETLKPHQIGRARRSSGYAGNPYQK